MLNMFICPQKYVKIKYVKYMVCFLEKNIWLDRSYDNSKASRFLALAAPNTTKPIGPIYFSSRWAAVDRLNGMLRVSLQR